MGVPAPNAQAQFAGLRKAYEEAFQEFSRQVRLLQSLMNHPTPDKSAMEEAGRLVEQARSAYRESRDALARFMLSRGGKGGAQETLSFRTGRGWDLRSEVEGLAYRLWEEAGRPAGRAQEHWYRAERLIHTSS